jgi:hypothetical protein
MALIARAVSLGTLIVAKDTGETRVSTMEGACGAGCAGDVMESNSCLSLPGMTRGELVAELQNCCLVRASERGKKRRR